MNAGERATERVDQKRRTRHKLLAAARAIVEEGTTLTIAKAAERADVAEATAYRYYRNPRSLLRDALSIDWSGLDELLTDLGTLPDPADRARRAAEEMARFVLVREFNIRMLFASTDQAPRDPDDPTGLPKTSFRRRLVQAVLRGSEDMLGADFRSVQLALTVVISPHAVLLLRDAMLTRQSEFPANWAAWRTGYSIGSDTSK